MIDLLAVQVFRAFGCAKVFAVDLDKGKLELARRLGADETFLANDPELIARLQEVTGGRGTDIAVEVAGVQQSVVTAIKAVRRGGTVALIGVTTPNVKIVR